MKKDVDEAFNKFLMGLAGVVLLYFILRDVFDGSTRSVRNAVVDAVAGSSLSTG